MATFSPQQSGGTIRNFLLVFPTFGYGALGFAFVLSYYYILNIITLDGRVYFMFDSEHVRRSNATAALRTIDTPFLSTMNTTCSTTKQHPITKPNLQTFRECSLNSADSLLFFNKVRCGSTSQPLFRLLPIVL